MILKHEFHGECVRIYLSYFHPTDMTLLEGKSHESEPHPHHLHNQPHEDQEVKSKSILGIFLKIQCLYVQMNVCLQQCPQ